MSIKLMFYSKKSPTYFNLYNPAFCSQLIRISLAEYENKSAKRMEFPLLFLILPLLLHKEIRDTISHYHTFHSWSIQNFHKLVDFNVKTNNLINLTKASLIFLLQTKSISIDKKGRIGIIDYKDTKRFLVSDREIRDFYNKSRYVGRWLAFTDDVPTIFSLLGVRP